MRSVTRSVSVVIGSLVAVVSLASCSTDNTFEYVSTAAQASAMIKSGMLPEQLPEGARDIRVLSSSHAHVATWHGDLIADPSCVPAEGQPPKGNRIVLESQTIGDVQKCSFGFQGRDGGSVFWWPAE